MAEAIASTILKRLTAITIDKASEKWTLVRGVEEQVERLEHNFKALRYELEDAEEKQYLNKRLKHWLDRFKQVSYDMEDILDDCEAALQEVQTSDDGAETSTTCVPKLKVCPFVSCLSFGSQVVKRHRFATKIKNINEELDKIVKDKANFELIKREAEITGQSKRPESTSFVDVSRLHGREEVKGHIIRTLLCGTSEEGSRIPTISIVGMGGIGKTTLAQLIYNDHRIQTHFDKRIWVCVSDPFDQSKIARAILEALDPDSTIFLATTLQTLLSKIRTNIKEKKFFLVLDDVWIDRGQDWEKLEASFQSHMSGSRILITTRKESVAKHMESSHVFPLNLLPDDVCWRILSQKAFSGRNKINCENLEDIGRAIAKKCKGLPLAAIALGGLLLDKLGREEWEDVLNSEIWESDIAQEYIFTPLLLSYYDLPSAIRLCLLYCAIFPKGYEINKHELMQHWIAQGYLDSDDNLGTELKGEYYFGCLATRSFFQNFFKDDSGDIIRCKMHDLVHDFLRFLTGDEFVTKEIDKNLTLDLSSKKIRHVRLVFRGRGLFCSINGVEKLRSFVTSSVGFNGITTAALQFSQFKHLRLLDCNVIEQFPHGIAKLIHLMYLRLVSCNGLKNLPEAVCELPNLQSLSLQDCIALEKLPDEIRKLINLRYLRIKSCSWLKELPAGIGKLINLRYLSIEGCPKLRKLPVGIGNLINLRYLSTVGSRRLTYYPKGIGNLTSLKRLSNIRMRADGNDGDEFSIGDLENLDLLGGFLHVELIGSEIDWNELKRAKLHKKIHLKRMNIHTGLKGEEVLLALSPSPSDLRVSVLNY